MLQPSKQCCNIKNGTTSQAPRLFSLFQREMRQQPNTSISPRKKPTQLTPSTKQLNQSGLLQKQSNMPDAARTSPTTSKGKQVTLNSPHKCCSLCPGYPSNKPCKTTCAKCQKHKFHVECVTILFGQQRMCAKCNLSKSAGKAPRKSALLVTK